MTIEAVVLDNLRSAQNTGSVLRTCDALGIKRVIFLGITPGVDNPKVKKTSLGAENNIRIEHLPNGLSFIAQSKARGFKIIALEISSSSKDIGEIHSSERVILILGNEISGVSDEIQELADDIAHIPMSGIKESLNVSVAFGIAAYLFQKN